LSIKIPTGVKKVLTTMQIIQFVIGASFAFAHLIIAYQIPVSVPYTFSLADLTSVASAVTTDTAGAVSTTTATATATASAGVASWIKKLAFRAAGREGLAENVVNEQGETFGIDAVHAAEDLKAREEVRYRDELQWIHCTDTSGQTFAILLNCIYLAPLTFLFVKFFIRAYSKRLERRRSSAAYNFEQAARDAFHGVARQAVDAIGDMHGAGDGEMVSTTDSIESSKTPIEEHVDSTKKSVSEGPRSGEQATKHEIESTEKEAQESTESFKQSSEQAADSAQQLAEEGADAAQESVEEGADATQQPIEEEAEATEDSAKESGEAAEESSIPETAATTEPMADGGDLAEMNTELHKEGLQ
jgi:hypothetical protein